MMIRDLNKTQMESILCSEVVGHLGCYADGRLYVVPTGYVYHDGNIFAHSGLGLKIEMMHDNPNVCIQIDHITDLATWQSVIVWGRFEELHGQDAEEALRRIVEKL